MLISLPVGYRVTFFGGGSNKQQIYGHLEGYHLNRAPQHFPCKVQDVPCQIVPDI